MTDQRPRYGELATPEEQRRAAGLPPLDQVVIDDPAAGAHPAGPMIASAAAQPASGERAAADEASTRRHPVDRLVTIALLAYGLVNVVITAIGYLDLTAVMNQAMSVLGIEGEFTNYAQGRLWGTIAAVVLVVGWVLTAMLAVRRLRRGPHRLVDPRRRRSGHRSGRLDVPRGADDGGPGLPVIPRRRPLTGSVSEDEQGRLPPGRRPFASVGAVSSSTGRTSPADAWPRRHERPWPSRRPCPRRAGRTASCCRPRRRP